jgi:energy-coupling factor transporter transmembrane protein EcfT
MDYYRFSKYFVFSGAILFIVSLVMLFMTWSWWASLLMILLLLLCMGIGVVLLVKAKGVTLFRGVLLVIIILILPLFFQSIWLSIAVADHPYWWSDNPSLCEGLVVDIEECYTKFAVKLDDPSICNKLYFNSYVSNSVETCMNEVQLARSG